MYLYTEKSLDCIQSKEIIHTYLHIHICQEQFEDTKPNHKPFFTISIQVEYLGRVGTNQLVTAMEIK